MLRHANVKSRSFWHAIAPILCLLLASCSDGGRPFVPKPGTSYDPDTGLPLEILSSKDKGEMVLVRAGAFRRGNPAGIVVRTEMKAFYVDRHEVTNEEYSRFVSATGASAPSFSGDEAVLFRWTDGTYPAGRERYPVVLVAPGDAEGFAEWAGKRLPSQLEWEYAARGPASRQFPWGEAKLPPAECNTADRLAGRELSGPSMWQEWHGEWVKQKPEERNARALQPVGSFPKDVSPFGCYDLGGNVREWCVTREQNGILPGLAPDSGGRQPVATNGHVVCGGSWLASAQAASAWRYEPLEPSQYYDVGFRCVVSADEPTIQALAKPLGERK